jgi:NAD(P)-dependent dehydrogenase (short-subunit alcohol dehydrogenase family)
MGHGSIRPVVQHEREGAVLSASGTVAGVREPSVYRDQRLGQSAHRDADIERYAATKAAMISLTKTLSGELISRGIRVDAVSAGPIMTPLHAGRSEGAKAEFIRQIPVGRFGRPSEIANAVVFLASDEAAFTVGAELLIDGGMSL